MGMLYYQIADVTDWGTHVTKLVLAMPREVAAEELAPDQFSVYVELRDANGDLVRLPKSFLERDHLLPSAGFRPVTAAYPADRDGRRAVGKSRYVALEMPYGPIHKLSTMICADHSNLNGHGRYVSHVCRVTQTASIGSGDEALTGLVFDTLAGVANPKADRFRRGVSSHAELPIRYGYYTPRRLDGKKPLIVFLHGAGEGGYDLPVAWTGNKVTALTEDEIQAYFGGAFVLVPQCDTMWMNDGSGRYGDSGVSMYTEALKSLIDEFLDAHSHAVDRGRVYIGGDSNGGFMTMRMCMSYPGFFAAAFPICEAMLDKRVSEEDIARLRELPIWFVHAKNDPVVKPEDYVLPTYRRLMAAGAKNCHFTFWDRIVDLHGTFRDEKGQPFEYLGHFAWIPVFNDDCRADFDGAPVLVGGKEAGLFEWLAAQKR